MVQCLDEHLHIKLHQNSQQTLPISAAKSSLTEVLGSKNKIVPRLIDDIVFSFISGDAVSYISIYKSLKD